MRDILALFLHLIVTLARLTRPGGLRSVVAESVLVRHQLLILNRSRKSAPNLCVSDRNVAGLCSLQMRPTRLLRSAIVLRPSTLLAVPSHAHQAKVPSAVFAKAKDQARAKWSRRGHRSRRCRDETTQSNVGLSPYRRADQPGVWNFSNIRMWFGGFWHYQPLPNGGDPSWLTFLGHAKDSLWSIDLLRCESITLRTYWVLVVMDQCTRRIIGFGIQAGVVDGLALCRMSTQAIRGTTLPKYLSSDHDPLNRFHQWQANLRILGVMEIKTVPYVPLSHPFIERLIGTTRRECMDQKLWAFKSYYNVCRTHDSLKGETPIETPESKGIDFKSYRWQKHCRGLYQTPIAA